MKKTLLMSAASAMALLVTACGTSEDAAEKDAAGNDMNAMMADANNPFAQSEMQMNERMMAAVGTDVGDTWVRKMMEHHQGAIDMSQIALQQNSRADVAEMARMTVEKQGKEIEDLRKLVKQGTPNPQSTEVYRSAMTQMHDAMMAAKGADISETFLRKMLEHHRGGVALSDVALQNGVSGALRQRVQKTRDEQQKEAQMIEAMLRGEMMSHAMHESAAKPAQGAQPQAAPAAKAKPAAQSAPKSAPKAPPAKTTPPAEPKPDPSCTPEHRAAGHC